MNNKYYIYVSPSTNKLASGCLGSEAQVTCHYYWIFNHDAAKTVPWPGTVLSGHVVLSS